MSISDIDLAPNSHRAAGWAAVAAGIFGLAAFAFIIAALMVRADARHIGALMFRWHDAMAILQALCMFVVVAALCSLANSAREDSGLVQQDQRHRAIGSIAYRVANATLAVLVLALLLAFAHILNDMLYMIPQGIFGLWMIWVSRHLSGLLARPVKWLGTVAGIGLTLIGIFPIVFGIFVDPIVFRGPIPPDYQDVNSTANIVAHVMLAVGTLIGIPLYPLWSIALGRTLLGNPASCLQLLHEDNAEQE